MIKLPEQLRQPGLEFVLLNPKSKIPMSSETDWTNKIINFDDSRLLLHEGNIGIKGGGTHRLVIVDCDNKEVQDVIEKMLPPTFTVASGGKGLYHFYYYATGDDECKSFKVFDKDKKTLMDFQANKKYVVAPNSEHENGNTWRVIKDIAITTINYKELVDIVKSFDKSEKIEVKEKKEYVKPIGSNPNDDLVQSCLLTDVINYYGLDLNDNNKMLCPFHNDNDASFLIDEDGITGHCFGCDTNWNSTSFIKKKLNCDYDEALDVMAKIKGVKRIKKPRVGLPRDGVYITSFAKEVANHLKPTDTIFYRSDLNKVVEIQNIKIDEEGKNVYSGFVPIDANRFVSIIEEHMKPMGWSKNTRCNVERSLSPANAGIVLVSDALIKNINSINRIYKFPMPKLENNILVFPKKGYDIKLRSWLPFDSPEIDTNMKLEDAKKKIDYLFSEFPFETEGDRDRAISGLITPCCRNLYVRKTCRVPLYIYKANQPRGGKDCMAGMTGCLYEGNPNEDAAISTSDHNNNSSVEFGKRLLAAMISGRTRMHFSNCKGNIDNGILEGAITKERHSDRQLQQNKNLEFDNEMEFSLSTNAGLTYSGDFPLRCRIINLFLAMEDVNSRTFKNSDLWGYVLANRSKILSCIYTLIRNWVETGMKPGSVPFASFPEWARVVGGIMEAAGYGTPCGDDKGMINVGGDEEKENMIALWKEMGRNHSGKLLNIVDIHDIITGDPELRERFQIQSTNEKNMFSRQLKRFKGRELGDVVFNINEEMSKTRFIFKNIVKEVPKDL